MLIFVAFSSMLMSWLGTIGFRRETLMARRNGRREVYTVVEVWRGIASGVRTFTTLDRAQRYMRRVQGRYNLMEDDIRLFKSLVL